MLEALKDKLPQLNFVIQNVVGRRMVGVNMSQKTFQYPKIYYTGGTAHFAPPKTIREVDLIPVDVFEVDTEKLDNLLRYFSFSALVSNIYLRASLDSPYPEDFKDSKFKYYFFSDVSQPVQYDEDTIIGVEETPEGTYYRVAPYIFKDEICAMCIHTVKAGGFSATASREDPFIMLFITWGRFILRDLNNVCSVQEFETDGVLLWIGNPLENFQLMLGDRQIPYDAQLFIVKKDRIWEVVYGDLLHESIYEDTNKRQEYLTQKLWEKGYYVSMLRGGNVWVGQAMHLEEPKYPTPK